MSSTLLSVLPGEIMPVANVMPALAREWDSTGASPEMAVRASQMNLVLHLGADVDEEDAKAQCEVALQLAQRHPCRIIILCPDPSPSATTPLEGKLHIGCFVEESREHRCCEMLALGYPVQGNTRILENQLSVWLESDLPTYHWFHRVGADTIARQWVRLVKDCRRVLYDSSICQGDFSTIPWARPYAARDLAVARLLPVRQALGQFLSAYPPKLLVENLRSVKIEHSKARCGEATGLLAWMKSCFVRCAEISSLPLNADFNDATVETTEICLTVDCDYTSGNLFHWEHSSQNSEAIIRAKFNGSDYTHHLRVHFLNPAQALAEALFA
ncbi:MAG: glucose-6-phosphate dehydrogenase assembly protein OpcA [Puniceicoccales bacterium]|jgi:hypothetical protein|nr:glucose-6-phosphate dehydrogenase assembly protein OpcA [Puniceicoccales bacterium]